MPLRPAGTAIAAGPAAGSLRESCGPTRRIDALETGTGELKTTGGFETPKRSWAARADPSTEEGGGPVRRRGRGDDRGEPAWRV